MKWLSKTKQRRVFCAPHDDGFIVGEDCKFTPLGYQRGKWEAERVFLTREEIKTIYETVISTGEPVRFNSRAGRDHK